MIRHNASSGDRLAVFGAVTKPRECQATLKIRTSDDIADMLSGEVAEKQ